MEYTSLDEQFTISMLTEKASSALLRIVSTLARHRLQIESLTSAAAASSDLYRHTVVVRAEPDHVRRAMKQLDTALGVLQADYYPQGATVDRELGLFKLSVDLASGGDSLERLVRRSRAKVVLAGPDYVVIEKTGSREEIEELLTSFEPFGVMEFVRSGQTTVTKPMAAVMVHEEIGTE